MKDLRQLFKDNFSCYADTTDESVVLAMDEDQFVKVVKEAVNNALQEASEKACLSIRDEGQSGNSYNKRKYFINGGGSVSVNKESILNLQIKEQ